MAEEAVDLRETALHPRHCARLVGHGSAFSLFERAFHSGKPHHAWLISGPVGIGKASFAYAMAKKVLATGAGHERALSWLAARSHPDLHVLELAVSDAKSGKLRSEISVEDVHAFTDFFGRTAAHGGWRVGIVDCADDLNREGANALLKLVEEPPSNSLIFIVNNQPGKLPRTLRSRCLRMPLSPLTTDEVDAVFSGLPLEERPEGRALIEATALSRGSPGRALGLLNSAGAEAYRAFLSAQRLDAGTRHNISGRFSNKATLVTDYLVFMDLLQGWVGDRAAAEAASPGGLAMAQLGSSLIQRRAEVEGFNLDRRVAVLDTLAAVQDALMAA
jgi:DNA polymerase III subunit delta'